MAKDIHYVLAKAKSKFDAIDEADFALDRYKGSVFNHKMASDPSEGENGTNSVHNAAELTPNLFLEKIESLTHEHFNKMNEYLKDIEGESIASLIQHRKEYLWQAISALEIANNLYTSNSVFFNAIEDSTLLSDNIKVEIYKNPEYFWLIPVKLWF